MIRLSAVVFGQITDAASHPIPRMMSYPTPEYPFDTIPSTMTSHVRSTGSLGVLSDTISDPNVSQKVAISSVESALRLVREPFVGDSSYVEITTMSYIPGTVIERHIGRLCLHFVKESHMDYEPVLGGMASFANGFVTECFAIARSHAAALGGTAIIGFRLDQAVFFENLKNVAYSLISVSGDVVVAQLKYRKRCVQTV
ncbi:hypothetical protein M427DRAFT_415971 [Gonapodya prolifera JEL478]|uniref:C2CD5 C-terminal domain-containing protein n=1 Tax=Gonapodya prolifera (strain JEL478) TaxID=1344416 RepID=A0A139A506_GONPJ|nr:hypothetical protein M427DRAFT_415971 [Gonapodya prolifera JEL478]|eukprot:KXS11897.1 hypothetical protein M427DRAFT_415971 [Gonapodya prolifera JEL478]